MPLTPFDTMPEVEREEWVDYIANCALGEMHCNGQTGADREAIIDLMLGAGHDECVRCGWWEEVSRCEQIGGECVCEDCREDGEEMD